MSIVVVDLGSGNLRSAAKALERASAMAGLSQRVVVSHRPEDVAAADHVVLPGQGAFAACRQALDAEPGLLQAINEAVILRGQPFFGICVGMQLMVDRGQEHGDHPGLGWIPGVCAPLSPRDATLKIPHMGWNDLTQVAADHPVMRGITPGDHLYFVHSYHVCGAPSEMVLAQAEYGGTVAAMIGRDNMVGAQFHVEKSQIIGLRMLANFCAWRP